MTKEKLQSEESMKKLSIYVSKEWKEGNTRQGKGYDYNQNFEMKYRVSNIRNCVEKCTHTQGNTLGNVEIQGGHILSMGRGTSENDSSHICNSPSVSVSECPSSTRKDIFTSLETIKNTLSDEFCLNIAYDCEFQTLHSDSPDMTRYQSSCSKIFNNYHERIILSYQFALYLDDQHILEVIFISKNHIPSNRLTLNTCIGSILSLICNDLHLPYIKCSRKNGSLCYTVVENMHNSTKYTEFETAVSNTSNCIPVLSVNSSDSFTSKNAAEIASHSLPVAIVCHSGIADLTAFKNDTRSFNSKTGSLLPYLCSVQGGLVSFSFTEFLCNDNYKYWVQYPVRVCFRDTMCYAPADKKSLESLGTCIGIPKIYLDLNTKRHMLDYLLKNPIGFCEYGSQDSLITLQYGTYIWGVNKMFPITLSSAGEDVIYKYVANYLDVDVKKNDSPNLTDFLAKYSGSKIVSSGLKKAPCGLVRDLKRDNLNDEAGFIHQYASKSYCGGYNACLKPGVFEDTLTYDFDIMNAYPTAMCLVHDINWEHPIEEFFYNEELSLDVFNSPTDMMFCLVDFEFPPDTKYPCIAIRHDNSIVFPLSGTYIYAAAPSLYLALKLGAKIHIHTGFRATPLQHENTVSQSLRFACKQLVNDRNIIKENIGTDTVEETFLKTITNASTHGKVAQNVIKKATWDSWNGKMREVGDSKLTSPERASVITDLVRCMLIGCMNQLDMMGYHTYSVTTDGFITDAPTDVLEKCDCYGFTELFQEARLFLTNNKDSAIWKIMHRQTTLINPTTRCNIGYGPFEQRVLAHGGYCSGQVKDSEDDRNATAYAILTRIGKHPSTTLQFANLKELMQYQVDFFTDYETVNIFFSKTPFFNCSVFKYNYLLSRLLRLRHNLSRYRTFYFVLSLTLSITIPQSNTPCPNQYSRLASSILHVNGFVSLFLKMHSRTIKVPSVFVATKSVVNLPSNSRPTISTFT